MSVNIINRLIVSPGKQHRQITNFLINELAINPTEIHRKKEHLRLDFVIQNRSAEIELRALTNHFPSYNFDLLWFDEPCTYVKALRVLESNFYPTSYICWGLNDYFNDDLNKDQLITSFDYDWTALEYDLLLASYSGGFLENTKIIPDLQKFEALDLLLSRKLASASLSAQALVIHLLSEGISVQDIPLDYLSNELYLECFQLKLIPFERLPESLLSEEFLEKVCYNHGKSIFSKINPKLLTEDICLAAITAIRESISLKMVPSSLRTQIICEFALHQEIDDFRFIPRKILSQEFCNEYPAALKFIPNDFKTLELCKNALKVNSSNLEFVPKHFINKTLINKIARDSNASDSFLGFVPSELFTSRLVKIFIKKNPREFQFIPEEFKTYEISKKYIVREIENLIFASPEMLDDLLKHRTIKSMFLKHDHSLSLLPKSYLTKEFVFEIFKSNGIQLDEVPNHLISEPMILLCVRRIRKVISSTELNHSNYQLIAKNCSKPKVWLFSPNKIKDYEFCRTAIVYAHPSVEADVLVSLIDNTARDTDAFNETIQWLYYFIDNKLSLTFRDQHLFQMDLSDYLEKTLDGNLRDTGEINTFVSHLILDIVQSPKQLQAFQEITKAAWRLWVELCSSLSPVAENIDQSSILSLQATHFLDSTKKIQILNLYLKIVEQMNSENKSAVNSVVNVS